MPAPSGLHHAPRCTRRSTRDSLTYVSRLVLDETFVGRSGPPQPLREVSMSMPRLVGKPSATSRRCMCAVKSTSSRSLFHS